MTAKKSVRKSAKAQTRNTQTLCCSCAPVYRQYRSVGHSMGGQCFGCGSHHELLMMYDLPTSSKPLSHLQVQKLDRVSQNEAWKELRDICDEQPDGDDLFGLNDE